MALNGLFCADATLRNYSLAHWCHYKLCHAAGFVCIGTSYSISTYRITSGLRRLSLSVDWSQSCEAVSMPAGQSWRRKQRKRQCRCFHPTWSSCCWLLHCVAN